MSGRDEGNVEKMKVVNHMLMNSPPGQFIDVLTDIKKLVGSEVLNEETSTLIAKAYNEVAARLIECDGRFFIIAKEGALGDSRYIDSKLQKVIDVNHLNAKVVKVHEENYQSMFPEIESFRKEAEEALEEYRKAHLNAPASSSAVFSAEGGKLILYTSAENLNLRNWWSGNWVGRYELCGLQEDTATVSGAISICTHYFESGNMQLRSKKELPSVLIGPVGGDVVASAIKWIRNEENALQESIESLYAGMNNSLKLMRRPVTLTAEKFSWQINQIKVRNTFITSKKEST